MTLYDFFKENKDKRFVFVRANMGNYGDDLICLGARKMAQDLKIDFNEHNAIKDGLLHLKKGNEDVIIYIHGCGGLGSIYDYPVLYTADLRIKNPKNLIVWGGATVMLQRDFFKMTRFLDKNMIFFAREYVSYAFMKSVFPDNDIRIDECPSFYLKKEDFLSPKVNLHLKSLFIREDKYEKIDEPKMEEDFKKMINLRIDPVNANSFDEWVSFHMHSDLIVTNRCHSAILGSILGKDTYIFKNNYFKNRALFKHSLEKRGVKWLLVD